MNLYLFIFLRFAVSLRIIYSDSNNIIICRLVIIWNNVFLIFATGIHFWKCYLIGIIQFFLNCVLLWKHIIVELVCWKRRISAEWPFCNIFSLWCETFLHVVYMLILRPAVYSSDFLYLFYFSIFFFYHLLTGFSYFFIHIQTCWLCNDIVLYSIIISFDLFNFLVRVFSFGRKFSYSFKFFFSVVKRWFLVKNLSYCIGIWMLCRIHVRIHRVLLLLLLLQAELLLLLLVLWLSRAATKKWRTEKSYTS